MNVELEKTTFQKVDRASKLLGIKKNQLIDRAVLVYIDNLSKYLDLKQELDAWDVLSDEALTNFEKAL
ncbi:hypothetical protein J4457_04005 [Candidatus Woesearchaeota archaeon]|nr:hypothetical protein [Candidatus Woesearchaeota archaeon]